MRIVKVRRAELVPISSAAVEARKAEMASRRGGVGSAAFAVPPPPPPPPPPPAPARPELRVDPSLGPADADAAAQRRGVVAPPAYASLSPGTVRALLEATRAASDAAALPQPQLLQQPQQQQQQRLGGAAQSPSASLPPKPPSPRASPVRAQHLSPAAAFDLAHRNAHAVLERIESANKE